MRQATAAAAARSFTLLMSARIGHGGIAWRRSLGDGKRQRCSMVRVLFYCTMVLAHTLLCGGCRCERLWRIDLVLNKIRIPLVSKGLRNRLLALALDAYISIIYHILLSRHLCTKPNP